MRDVIGPAIGREEESRNGRGAGIVASRHVEFEKVEETQGGNEKGDAPEGSREHRAQQQG